MTTEERFAKARELAAWLANLGGADLATWLAWHAASDISGADLATLLAPMRPKAVNDARLESLLAAQEGEQAGAARKAWNAAREETRAALAAAIDASLAEHAALAKMGIMRLGKAVAALARTRQQCARAVYVTVYDAEARAYAVYEAASEAEIAEMGDRDEETDEDEDA